MEVVPGQDNAVCVVHVQGLLAVARSGAPGGPSTPPQNPRPRLVGGLGVLRVLVVLVVPVLLHRPLRGEGRTRGRGGVGISGGALPHGRGVGGVVGLLHLARQTSRRGSPTEFRRPDAPYTPTPGPPRPLPSRPAPGRPQSVGTEDRSLFLHRAPDKTGTKTTWTVRSGEPEPVGSLDPKCPETPAPGPNLPSGDGKCPRLTLGHLESQTSGEGLG